jgi:hypothetical protein
MPRTATAPPAASGAIARAATRDIASLDLGGHRVMALQRRFAAQR